MSNKCTCLQLRICHELARTCTNLFGARTCTNLHELARTCTNLHKHSTKIRPTHHSNCKMRLFFNYIHVLKIRPTDQLNCGNLIDRFEICCTPREEKKHEQDATRLFLLFFQAPEGAFLRVPPGRELFNHQHFFICPIFNVRQLAQNKIDLA